MKPFQLILVLFAVTAVIINPKGGRRANREPSRPSSSDRVVASAATPVSAVVGGRVETAPEFRYLLAANGAKVAVARGTIALAPFSGVTVGDPTVALSLPGGPLSLQTVDDPQHRDLSLVVVPDTADEPEPEVTPP